MVVNNEEFGMISETLEKPFIESYFDCEFNTTSKYSSFDFINNEEKIVVELKTRRNSKNKYPSTLVGVNKIESGYEYIKEGYSVYFIFKFIDGIYKFQLTDNCIKPYWIRCGGSQKWGKKYCYLPVGLLKSIM